MKKTKENEIEDCLVYGNVVNPKNVFLFEKPRVFEKAVDILRNKVKVLLICSVGMPSSNCLKFIEKIKAKKISYIGDLDPTSLLIYLTILYGKINFTSKSKIKKQVKFTGVTYKDYKDYLSEKVLIKLTEDEKQKLNKLLKFNVPQIKKEAKFLSEKGYKVEIEAVHSYGMKKYLQNKLKG